MRSFLNSGLAAFCVIMPKFAICRCARKTCDVVRAIVTEATRDRAPSQAGPGTMRSTGSHERAQLLRLDVIDMM